MLNNHPLLIFQMYLEDLVNGSDEYDTVIGVELTPHGLSRIRNLCTLASEIARELRTSAIPEIDSLRSFTLDFRLDMSWNEITEIEEWDTLPLPHNYYRVTVGLGKGQTGPYLPPPRLDFTIDEDLQLDAAAVRYAGERHYSRFIWNYWSGEFDFRNFTEELSKLYHDWMERNS